MAGATGFLGASGEQPWPMLGAALGTIDAALIAQMSRIVERRARLAADADARIAQLRAEDRLDEEAVQTEQFQALVMFTAVASAQESEPEKIDLYAAILAGAVSKTRPPDMNVRALLSSMTFLTADEMRLARAFYADFEAAKHSITDGLPPPPWGADAGLYLRRLEAANLIVPRRTSGPPRFQGPEGNYFITDTFRRLMQLLSETDTPAADKN